MSLLDVAVNVSLRAGLERPTQLVASTEREYIELFSIIKEARDEIVDAFDWQKLKKIATITGDGTSESFPLPSDYDRMQTTASLWNSRWLWAMQHITDTDEWLEILTVPITMLYGVWTIYGDELHIREVMANGETSKFFYITENAVADSGGTPKAEFTDDDDVFRLSERLLMFCSLWKWKAYKGMEYAEDMANYNLELKHEIEKDGGSKPVVSGSPYVSWKNKHVAWPGSISGVVP